MNNGIHWRIKAVEKALKDHNAGMFIVHYKDGSTRQMPPGDAILLSLNEEAGKIERFEEEPGSDNGILEALANALLPGNNERTE